MQWRGHAEKMAAAWDATVTDEDIVLCPGDLSWALKLEDAAADLAWIGARKGKLKILVRGNHDYWWSAIGKVRSALPASCVALQNDAMDLGDVVIAGSRCWVAPGGYEYTEHDKSIYERELIRLDMSLKHAVKLANGQKPIIAAIHYPPFTAKKLPTGFSELLEKYSVVSCVYGHLHTAAGHRTARTGVYNGIHYHLLSCDYLDFKPIPVWPAPEASAAASETPAETAPEPAS